MRIASLLLILSIGLPSIALAQELQPVKPIEVKPMPAEPGVEGDDPLEPKPLTDEQKTALLVKSPVVFIAKVADVERSNVQSMIWPPRVNHFLKFSDIESLRGEKIGEGDRFQLTLVGQKATAPAQGDKVVIGDGKINGNWMIKVVVAADEAKIKAAKTAVSVPLGWKIEAGKPVSPWAAKGIAWPKDAAVKADVVCSKTGRPALSAAVSLSVEQVIPEAVKKFENPYGDGVFKVTVTNPTDKPLVVPALLTDGKTILWADSLVFMVSDQVFTLPPSGKLDANVQSVTLKPKESVSADINTLHLKGAPWPRGGSRINVTFCLGDVSQSNFFYYFSRHHDALIPK